MQMVQASSIAICAIWNRAVVRHQPRLASRRLSHPPRPSAVLRRESLNPKPDPAVRRRLAGVPHLAGIARFPCEDRKTGSAALECAFVAAGLLHVAYFERPNIWDVAGGVALVQASGGEVRMRGASGWEPLESFVPSAVAAGGAADLRNWHRPIVLDDRAAVTEVCERMAA